MTARTLWSLLLVAGLAGCGGTVDQPTAVGDRPAVPSAAADAEPARGGTGRDDSASGAARRDRAPSSSRRRQERRKKSGRHPAVRRVPREELRRQRERELRRKRNPLLALEQRDGRRSKSTRADRGRRRGGSRKRRASSAPTAGAGKWIYDRDEVTVAAKVVREYVRRVSAHDPSVCDELLTERFLEAMTGRTGQAAVERCRRQISSSKLPAELVSIDGGRVRSGEALIAYTARVGGRKRTVAARLRKVAGRYRIDGDGTAEARKIGT